MTQGAEAEGIEGAYSLPELADKLTMPRTIWMMLPAGRPVDDTIEAPKPLLAGGDTLVDGGNTYYKDDLRRSDGLKKLGIRYI
ncbi:MAG: NAD(P)-binding domain-containing protein, partial [Thermoleophilia bacterium]|nr:NAD(P)-binding domain-containing protein [Thermoleophilia bacterium]